MTTPLDNIVRQITELKQSSGSLGTDVTDAYDRAIKIVISEMPRHREQMIDAFDDGQANWEPGKRDYNNGREYLSRSSPNTQQRLNFAVEKGLAVNPGTYLIPFTGATFCGKHRIKLWRIWERSLPLVMVIGLNPSTADAENDDPTIKSIIRIAKNNGFGGLYMMNCWTFITSNPNLLVVEQDEVMLNMNNENLVGISKRCEAVVFAWGAFKIVQRLGRDKELEAMFPNALCIGKNADGSPVHPLYQKSDSKFIPWKQQ